MARKVLLLSHGALAKGMLNSVQMFNAAANDWQAISAYVDGCDPDVALGEFWNTVSPDDQVLIFTDILGGSVMQKVMPQMTERPNTYVYTGMNFPMLVQATCLPDDASEDDLRALVNTGKDGVALANDISVTADEEDE